MNTKYPRRGLILAAVKPEDLVERVQHCNNDSEGKAVKDMLDELSYRLCIMERNYLEEDPRFVQLLPYAYSKVDGKYAVYRRTPKVGESRLANKLSIGFGGHVDYRKGMAFLLDEKGVMFNHLFSYLSVDVERELDEECRFDTAPEPVFTGKFIYTEENEVSQVHLGLLFETNVEITNLKEEELEFLGYHTAEEILNMEGELEAWSRIVLEMTES